MTSHEFHGRNVLITGGLGFVGSNLARRLVHLGAHVILVDSLIPEYGGNLFNIAGIKDRVQVNISDVRDVYGMRCLIQGQDYLFNLAGQTSHIDSMQDPYTDLEINCRAQLSILEACRHYNKDIKIVFASTRQIYGKPDYLPVDEKHLLRPVDVTASTRWRASGITSSTTTPTAFARAPCGSPTPSARGCASRTRGRRSSASGSSCC